MTTQNYEFLLTSDYYAHGDGCVDRKWRIGKDDRGQKVFVKPDGTFVLPAYGTHSIYGLPEGTIIHLGIGFERNWHYAAKDAVLHFIRVGRFIKAEQ